MSDDGRSEIQSYYEYSPKAGGHWWVKDTPAADPAFQEGLNDLAGFSEGTRTPVLRLSWAGTLLHDVTEKPRLKYMAVREIVDGYYYVATDGTTKWVSSMNLADDAVDKTQFHPKMKRLELGRLRWVVERHIPASVLRAQKRFENRRAPDGELILRELPPEGIYEAFFFIETAKHYYREPDAQVLTAVQAMFLYNTTVSQAQQALDAIEREQTQTLIGAEEAKALWAGLGK